MTVCEFTCSMGLVQKTMQKNKMVNYVQMKTKGIEKNKENR